jgi:hypothetical protein
MARHFGSGKEENIGAQKQGYVVIFADNEEVPKGSRTVTLFRFCKLVYTAVLPKSLRNRIPGIPVLGSVFKGGRGLLAKTATHDEISIQMMLKRQLN